MRRLRSRIFAKDLQSIYKQNSMTPKEKAQELIDKYLDIDCVTLCNGCSIGIEEAKQCALITINEIIDFRKKIYFANHNSSGHKYLLEIKTEIENL